MKKAKRAKQTTIPEADTPLSKAVDDFIDNKIEIGELKESQSELEDKILIEMKKEGRDLMTVTHGGEQWEFEVLEESTKLRCAKKTKTPTSEKELAFPSRDGKK